MKLNELSFNTNQILGRGRLIPIILPPPLSWIYQQTLNKGSSQLSHFHNTMFFV